MSNYIIVKYQKAKKSYEILVNHGMVEKYRESISHKNRTSINIDQVVVADEVFKNSTKGTRYTNNELQEAFGTTDVKECIKHILLNGEVQLTTDDRKKKIEERRKQVVYNLHSFFIDPKTLKPHPVTHIENALNEIKFKVDMKESVEKQSLRARKELLGKLTLKKNLMEGQITIPLKYIGQCYNPINGLSTIDKENYGAKHYTAHLSLTPSAYDQLSQKINTITKGDFQFELDGMQTINSQKVEKKKPTKKGKGGKKRK